MKVNFYYWWFLGFGMLSMMLVGCASTGNPSGGPKDKKSPSLVVEKSTTNLRTNFFPTKIELEFDEWIELKNPLKEVLISPPFFERPKITSRGKKVVVEFPKDEALREDATYIINFGNSIVDFTESNAVKGFRFIFSTGDKIDSLTMSGSVVDAYDGGSVKDVLVLMYDVLTDSVVVTEKPFYYTRTDSEGKFKFENLKNDTFKILILEDKNVNYLLDAEIERVGFLDSLFILNDSTDYDPEFRLFLSTPPMRIINSNSRIPGRIAVDFNTEVKDIDIDYFYPPDFDPLVEKGGDSIRYWFSDTIDSVGIVFGLDTIDFTIKPFDSVFYKKTILKLSDNASSSVLSPFDSLVLMFDVPLLDIDTSKIRLEDKPIEKIVASTTREILSQDSLARPLDTISMLQDTLLENINEIQDSLQENVAMPIDSILKVDSIAKVDSLIMNFVDTIDVITRYQYKSEIELRKLVVRSAWKHKHSYRLTLYPQAVQDIYGRSNDTIVVDFVTSSADALGSITIHISGVDSTSQYVVLLRKGEKTIKKEIINNIRIGELIYERLPTETYNIQLILDENRDGKWTTGDYWTSRQPEFIKNFDQEKLRENWNLDADIFWDKKTSIVLDTVGISNDSLDVQIEIKDIKEKNRRPKTNGKKDLKRNNKGKQGKKN